MRQLTDDQSASFKSELLTLAMLLELTLNDGTSVKLTNHDADVGDYKSTFGLDIDNITLQLGGAGQTTTASVLPDLDNIGGGITVSQIESNALDGCYARVSLIDWSKPGATPFIMLTGYVDEAKYGNAGKLNMSLLTPLNKSRPICKDIVSQMCRADFGDERCGIKVDDGMIDGPHVEAPINDQCFLLSSDEQTPRNYYNNGTCYFTSGANKGLGYEILATTADPSTTDNETLFLKVPLVFPVQAGDTMELYPGCDKVLTSGCTFWNNQHNFQGEPYTVDPSKVTVDGCDLFGAEGNDGIGPINADNNSGNGVAGSGSAPNVPGLPGS
jgi:uncharacterized phage protein (TIGR02218 family)